MLGARRQMRSIRAFRQRRRQSPSSSRNNGHPAADPGAPSSVCILWTGLEARWPPPSTSSGPFGRRDDGPENPVQGPGQECRTSAWASVITPGAVPSRVGFELPKALTYPLRGKLPVFRPTWFRSPADPSMPVDGFSRRRRQCSPAQLGAAPHLKPALKGQERWVEAFPAPAAAAPAGQLVEVFPDQAKETLAQESAESKGESLLS